MPIKSIHALRYSLVGMFLGCGAPVGLLFVQLVAEPERTIVEIISSQLLSYIYITISTTVVLGMFGAILGQKEDLLVAHSQRDAVTGLFNRGALNSYLESEVRRTQRYDHPLSLLLIDVDKLKDINDEFGHQAGDWALVAVAEGIKRSIRTTDFAGRFGGDEFTIVAPSTTLQHAMELGDRVRKNILEVGEKLENPNGCPCPTVSVGISAGGGKGQENGDQLTSSTLIAQADQALYSAKEKGRDRVERYQ